MPITSGIINSTFNSVSSSQKSVKVESILFIDICFSKIVFYIVALKAFSNTME